MTVDFYELGDGIAVVDQLNTLTPTSIINISAHKPERKLLTIKDMLGRKVDVKKILYFFTSIIMEQ